MTAEKSAVQARTIAAVSSGCAFAYPRPGLPAYSVTGFARLGLINWLSALAIVGLYTLTQTLDTLPDHHAEHAQAQTLLDAQRAAQAQQRRMRAALAICGSGAAVAELPDGQITCRRHTGSGKNTTLAQIQLAGMP